MSVVQCLLDKAKAGRLSPQKAQEFVDQINAAGGNQGQRDAAELVLKTAKRTAENRKRRTFLQIARQTEIKRRIEAAGPEKAEKAALSILHFDETGEFGGTNVYLQAQVIENQVFSEMTEFFERFRSKLAGLQRAGKDMAGMRNMVRAMFGETTPDESANQIAQVVSEALENLRQRGNLAGMNIGKLTNFGLPQTHDRLAVASVVKEDWISYIFPRLDRERMKNLDTGLPLSDDELTTQLGAIYDDIVTDGLVDVQPGKTFAINRQIDTKRQQARQLHFKSADDWIDYQQQYGAEDLFSHLTNHIRGMSNDIAAMEVMGPNPDASLQFMQQVVGSVRGKEAIGRVGREARDLLRQDFNSKLNRLYAVVTKSYLTPEREWWANLFAGTRNLITSSTLGGSFLSALTDVGFQSLTASYNGLSTTRILRRQIKTFSTASAVDRRKALQNGISVESWTAVAGAQQRYVGEVIGPEWTQRISDIVLRATWLSPWTDAGKVAFGHEMLFDMTENAGKTFGRLNDRVKMRLRRAGITAKEWNQIRQTPKFRDPDTGVEMLRPQDIIQADMLGPAKRRETLELASKYHAMVLQEQRFAVPETTAKVRTFLTGAQAPGSVAGELLRNVALFKSFPVTVIQMHLLGRGLMNAELGAAGKFKYLAHMFIATTIMGALAVELKDISKGKDPRPIGSKEFWGSAVLQGGGLGIMGDFLFSDVNRFGGGLSSTIAGPVVGLAENFLRLTSGNILELAQEGEAKSWGAELVRFMKNITPGQNAWYSRLAMERLVWDEILKLTDPDYANRFKRMRKRAERDFGQQFFSKPGGGIVPQRPPDLTQALRTGP